MVPIGQCTAGAAVVNGGSDINAGPILYIINICQLLYISYFGRVDYSAQSYSPDDFGNNVNRNQ